MKKITLFIALLCSISAFSTRYLVQQYGQNVWNGTTSSGTVVTLGSSQTFGAWYNATSMTAGSEVWLLAGTYLVTANITNKADVSLYGSFVGTETAVTGRSKVSGGKPWEFTNQTILDGNNSAGDFIGLGSTLSTNNTYIDGLQITRIKRTGVAAMNGGAVQLRGKVIMQNCIVSNNQFIGTTANEGKGAGVFIKDGQLINSYIHHNDCLIGTGTGAAYGGGIVIYGSALAVVRGCTIESNTATSSGGGIYLNDGGSGYYSGGTIQDCTFLSNAVIASNFQGGGGAIGGSASALTASLSITNCQFTGNTSSASGNTYGSGGAIFLSLTNVPISISGCSFIGNVSNAGTGDATLGGGAINIKDGVFTNNPIKNCFFRDNKITTACEGSAMIIRVPVTLQNCIFANNSSLVAGSTVAIAINGCKVLNCVFANNYTTGTGRPIDTTTKTFTLTNSMFWGNSVFARALKDAYTGTTGTYNAFDTDQSTYAEYGTGSIKTLTATNTFVSPTSSVGANSDLTVGAAADWSLKLGCPAINAGTDLAASGVTTDILGNPRPTGPNTVDMGAYEYGFTTAQTVTFGALSAKTYGDATFTLGATASSGLAVSYASSNTSVATVSGNTVTIVGAGSTNITASQPGNGSFAAASNVIQSLTVNPKTLTLTTPAATSKTYDGTNAAVVSSTVNGTVNSDVITCTTGTFASANVGSPIAVTCILSGVKAGNYTLTQPGITANITAKALTMFGLSVPASKTYDGLTTAVVTDAKTLQASEAAGTGTTIDGKPYTNDVVSITGTPVGTYNSKNVASANTVTYSGLSLTGAQAGNYSLTIQGTSSATITAKSLSITAPTIAPKVYDGSATSGTVTPGTLSGFVSPETVTVSSAVGTYADASVGTGKTATIVYTLADGTDGNGGLAANYSLANGSATGDITAGSITVSSNSNLSSYSPTSTTDVTVNAGYELTVNADANVKTITVAPGGKLTLSSGTLTVATTNGITLQSSSSGTGTIVDNYSTPTVGASVQQYLPQGRNWYLSIPVSSANTSSFIGSGLATSVSYWNEVGNGIVGAWINSYTGAMTPGKGYIAVSASGSGSGTNNASIIGTLNSGDVSVTLTRTGTGGFAGYNLIANPYPSYLNAMAAINANSNVQTTIWYRTCSTGGTYYFETVNTASGEGTNAAGTGTVTGYVPPMQAFWVRANTNNQTIKFTNSMRYHANPTISLSTVTTTPLKAKAQTSTQRLRLQVSNGTNTDETVIYTNPNASNGLDIYDSPKRSNNLASIPEIFTIAGTEQLVINGLYNIIPDQEIPLGLTPGTATQLSFKATELSNFDPGTRVILRDYLDPNNVIEQDLTDGTIYSFTTASATTTMSRFTVVFKSPSVTTGLDNNENKLNVSVFKNSKRQITVSCPIELAGKAMLSVYSALGQKLESIRLTSTITVLTNSFESGVYFVNVVGNGKATTQKIIIN